MYHLLIGLSCFPIKNRFLPSITSRIPDRSDDSGILHQRSHFTSECIKTWYCFSPACIYERNSERSGSHFNMRHQENTAKWLFKSVSLSHQSLYPVPHHCRRNVLFSDGKKNGITSPYISCFIIECRIDDRKKTSPDAPA